MCYLRRIAKIRFLPVFQIWLTLRPKKNKKLLFYGHWTRYDLLRGRTSAFLIFRSFGHSYGRSRQKGRTCRRHAMTDFMSNVNTKSVSATPALSLGLRIFKRTGKDLRESRILSFATLIRSLGLLFLVVLLFIFAVSMSVLIDCNYINNSDNYCWHWTHCVPLS